MILRTFEWHHENEAFKLSPDTSVNQERHFSEIAAASKFIDAYPKKKHHN